MARAYQFPWRCLITSQQQKGEQPNLTVFSLPLVAIAIYPGLQPKS